MDGHLAPRNAARQWRNVSHVLPQLLPIACPIVLEQFWYTSCHVSRKFPGSTPYDSSIDRKAVQPHDAQRTSSVSVLYECQGESTYRLARFCVNEHARKQGFSFVMIK